jgi:hypothetical protein
MDSCGRIEEKVEECDANEECAEGECIEIVSGCDFFSTERDYVSPADAPNCAEHGCNYMYDHNASAGFCGYQCTITCNDDNDCPFPFFCAPFVLERQGGGYCSKDCQWWAPSGYECPEGSTCLTVENSNVDYCEQGCK